MLALLPVVALWAAVRLALGLLLSSSKLTDHVQVDADWWRVTLRLPVDGGGGGGGGGGSGGWLSRTAARHRRSLRAWFGAGAAAGLAAGAASVAVLLAELATLLRPLVTPAGAAAVQPPPRLALALPGVTLPASHAAPLWLAIAASLLIHEAGHALAAAAEGVHVSNAGASLILLMPAAFVELDTAELAALPRGSLLRVACAGAWHNLALAAAAWLAQAAALRLGGMLGWVSGQLHLALGYTTALSLALALLNMAPIHWLDGQQALEALCRPSNPRAVSALPTDQRRQGEQGGGGGAKLAAGAALQAMRAPRWIAAVAVCLLVVAGRGAGAAPCNVGSVQMELVGAGTGLESNELAKCLPSFTATVDADCKVTLTATAATNASVPAMWSSDANMYKQFKLCPSVVLSAAAPSAQPTAASAPFSNALKGFVYGLDAQSSPLKPTYGSSAGNGIGFIPGRLWVVIGGVNLVYAIRSTTGTPTSIASECVVTTGDGLTAGTEFQPAANISLPCPTGRYGAMAGSIKLCPLCPAGTYGGDGVSCKACPAGTASNKVGVATGASCAQCPAGTYAPGGNTDCLPCPAHTYSAAGAKECTPCPDGTYAWIPGSTVCLRCTDGVPHLHTEGAGLPAASPGSGMLRFASKLGTACDALNSAFPIPALGACASWKAGTNGGASPPDLKLALEVAGDCSVTIKPIGDTSCADPGAVAGQTKPAPLSGTYGYTYNNLTMRAYYTSTKTLRMLLPSDAGGASSFMLHIDATAGSKTLVDINIYAATSKPSESSNPGSKTCSQSAAIDGGNVADATANCGAGSYLVANSCFACPQGHTCAGAAKTACAAATANPFLGQSTGGCTACDADTTSLAGSGYCKLPRCRPGSIALELLNTTVYNLVSRCLSSAVFSVDADCKYSIAAPTSDGSIVTTSWSSAGCDMYTEIKQCPAVSSAKVSSLYLALEGYVFGFNAAGTAPLLPLGIWDITFPSPGKVVVTADAGAVHVYAIRSATGNTAAFHASNAIVSNGTGLADGTEFRPAPQLGLPCAAGRYGLIVGGIKLCPLCPAGTTGTSGNSCKACPAGTNYGRVGWSGSCATCAPGTYAPEGSSHCQWCPPHTFSGWGAEECSPCPEDTFAHLPGSSECVRCAAGVAFPHTAANLPPPSEGSAILRFASKLGTTCDTLNSAFPVPALNACKSWRDGSNGGAPDLKLALAVADDCSVTIQPVGDKTCADPGAVAGTTALFPRLAGLSAADEYLYTYNDLTIRAYYIAAYKIRTLLPSSDGGASSFMLHISPKTATTVDLQFLAATNKPGDAGIAYGTKACTHEATVDGGSVTGVNVVPCGAGSYDESGCKPCPQGKTCAGGAAAPADCAADSANPFLGQAAGACKACNHDSTKFTSEAGAAYCSLPFSDRLCNEAPYTAGGWAWDEHAGACTKCRPGTYRSTAMLADGTPDCQECPPGTYSGEGAAECTPCPTGQYSPTSGMADQEEGGNGVHCLLCPTGSIALADGETINTTATIGGADFRNERPLSTGAAQCDACPSGTWANPDLTEATTGAKGCSLCPSGQYRSGDAAPENNMCRQIPPGYKAAATVLDAKNRIGAADIQLCSAGEVSFWSGSPAVRTPTDATTCKPCDKNSGTVAPRAGMVACTACSGGSYPNPKRTGCIQCAPGTFRAYSNASDTCTTCPAGWEVGNSGRTACTKCRKGFYKTTAGVSDFCNPCPRNTFQNTTGATSACIWCPAGKETLTTGNSACTDCPSGFYNPLAASSSAARACLAAPAGTFVNTTGALAAKQCPLGTFNDDSAQDSCESCPPGKYASTMGSQACKTCLAGTYSIAQASSCKVCATGYSSPIGSGSCNPCKPGTYASKPRSGTCDLCPKGFQCATPATATPKTCLAGSFAPSDGSTLCTPCPANTFSNTTGQIACQPCAAGTNTRGLTGQKACTAVRAAGLRRSVL